MNEIVCVSPNNSISHNDTTSIVVVVARCFWKDFAMNFLWINSISFKSKARHFIDTKIGLCQDVVLSHCAHRNDDEPLKTEWIHSVTRDRWLHNTLLDTKESNTNLCPFEYSVLNHLLLELATSTNMNVRPWTRGSVCVCAWECEWISCCITLEEFIRVSLLPISITLLSSLFISAFLAHTQHSMCQLARLTKRKSRTRERASNWKWMKWMNAK